MNMTCNGFNYHGEDELCEIIPYSLSGLQLIQNATGWKLWLSGMDGYILYLHRVYNVYMCVVHVYPLHIYGYSMYSYMSKLLH